MKPAPIPLNELARLKDLLDYDILDTTSEALFDEITVIASTICETPIAMVSLVDSERQWFKAKVGLNASETPRDVSFCGHAILQSEIFFVEDAAVDERFFDNPLVTGDLKIRFYAGAPLVTENGNSLGTLCVIDHVPRRLSAPQMQGLAALSRQVVALLEARRNRKALGEKFQELQNASKLLVSQEQALVATAKMSALGSMAAGIAHEINNPLAIIAATMDILAMKVSSGQIESGAILRDVEKTKAMIQRMAKIVRGLVEYSEMRPPASKPVVTSVRTIVEQVLLLCSERFANAKIEIRLDLADDAIECQQAQIEQVLHNLLNNAFRAVQTQENRWVMISSKALSEEEVQIAVTDSGKGIDPKIETKIMDPFFTTATVGQGVGLGLSISKGLVESHGGHLSYDPTKANTTFVIVLPKKQPQRVAQPVTTSSV